MDKRIIDIISTKYMAKRMVAELELEKLINTTPSQDLNIDKLTDNVMLKVNELRILINDSQMWENIVLQFDKNDGENNNK
jgi:hypothetical protein